MQLKKLLEKWDLTSLKITAPFLEMQWEPNDEDKTAALELYVELITRAATQGFDPDEGDEAAALKSVHELFPLTRETIKRQGRHCINFTHIAPWSCSTRRCPVHRQVVSAGARQAARRRSMGAFRAEHGALQTDLCNYTRLPADMADVEDLTNLEAV